MFFITFLKMLTLICTFEPLYPFQFVGTFWEMWQFVVSIHYTNVSNIIGAENEKGIILEWCCVY